ncbi:MAG: hypothetical protein EPO22_01595 [Dehalococcoidia bacterium]|nr:MAG: hypothetical protein EPO22_01595 [Dehalococcoidia bacterium]
MSLRAFDPSAPTCARCGTRHTARERCPTDQPPKLPIPAAAQPIPAAAIVAPAIAPPRAPVAAPISRCARCGTRHTVYERCPLARREPPISATPSAAARAAAARPAPSRGASLRSIVGYALAAVATLVLISTLTTAGVAIGDMTQADADVAAASWMLGISIVVGFIFGVELLFLSKRTYAKVVYCFLAVVLITAGVLMMTFAPVYRQVNTPDINEGRTFRALLLFGLASLLAGVLLAVLCVRWALRPSALARLKRWTRILGSIYGVILGIEGLFMLLAMFALIQGESSVSTSGREFSVVGQAIAFTVIAAWFFVPGVLLTYHGISASMGEGSSQYQPPIALVGIVLFAGVVAVGEVNMASGDAVAAPMPLLHVLAAALPGLTYVGLASRGSFLRGVPVRGLTWRQLTLAFALSMGVAAMIAMYVNSIAGLCATVLLLVHNGTFHHVTGTSGIGDRLSEAKDILSHNEQWVANLIAIAVVPPIVEEFAKGLGARFMMRGNTTRAQAYALGAAAGAGFGFLEGLLYGAGGISNELGDWWAIMLVRAGSTSLHVFNTGLVGLAWWYWSIARRPRVGVALFGAAVAAHAIWNGLAVTLFSQILWLRTVDNHILEIATYAMIGVLGPGLIGGIMLMARRLREPAPRPVAGTPLAAMAPWLG